MGSNIKELYKQLNEVSAQEKAIKARKAEIVQKIGQISGGLVLQARAKENKQNGSMSVNIDGYAVTETVKMTVEWDSEKLNQICSGNPLIASAMRDVIKGWTPKIDNDKYEALSSDVRSVVDAARKVKLSKPSIAVAEPKAVDHSGWEDF